MADNQATKNSNASILVGETKIQETSDNNNNQSQIFSADELMLKANKTQLNGVTVHKSIDATPLPNVKVSDIIGKCYHQLLHRPINI